MDLQPSQSFSQLKFSSFLSSIKVAVSHRHNWQHQIVLKKLMKQWKIYEKLSNSFSSPFIIENVVKLLCAILSFVVQSYDYVPGTIPRIMRQLVCFVQILFIKFVTVSQSLDTRHQAHILMVAVARVDHVMPGIHRAKSHTGLAKTDSFLQRPAQTRFCWVSVQTSRLGKTAALLSCGTLIGLTVG